LANRLKANATSHLNSPDYFFNIGLKANQSPTNFVVTKAICTWYKSPIRFDFLSFNFCPWQLVANMKQSIIGQVLQGDAQQIVVLASKINLNGGLRRNASKKILLDDGFVVVV
jgi:hypothetical protein